MISRDAEAMSTERYPVAIIGGGPVGLVSSIMLSLRNVPHILFERYPDTSIHPKACGLNQRTVEIFRKIGVEADFLQQRAPPERMGRTAWYTSLGPNGREIAARHAWGGGPMRPTYERASQSPYSVLPQIRLEPILQKRALELNATAINYSHDVLEVKEERDGVELTVLNKLTGKTFTISADYVLGADGGRGFADNMGVKWEGERDLVHMISAHLKAPISHYHPDPSIFITWFVNPALGGSTKSGYLYHLGPYPETKETQEWLFCYALNPEDPEGSTDLDALKRIRNTLQLPDLPLDILSISHWYVNARVLENYRSKDRGRILFVGDAAHRIPPWGALGLNSGLQDVDNLIWKLALAIKNPQQDFNNLLNTYSDERRPIGQRIAKDCLHNMRAHPGVMDRALGMDAEAPKEDNELAMKNFFEKSQEQRQEHLMPALDILDGEFYAQGAEVGWYYESADLDDEGKATRHDGQVLENGHMDTRVYHPSTIPGHSLPHAWLVGQDGKRLSTRDLLSKEGFVLLVQSSNPWAHSKHPLVSVEVIDQENGWKDVDGEWAAQGPGPAGAVLVRPDGVVAWRIFDASKLDAEEADKLLAEVVKRVLRV